MTREQTQFARRLRANMTDAERHLWQYLRAKRLLGIKFRRQQPMGIYVVDFVAYTPRLIVELDGGQHLQQQDYDARRDAWLAQQGFALLRFWNNEVLQETEAVLERIGQAITTALHTRHSSG